MELVLIWVIFSVLVGVFASTTGHSFFVGFTLSLILSPIIMGIFYLIVGAKQWSEQRKLNWYML